MCDKHLILDIYGISEENKLKDLKEVIPLVERLVEKLYLNVINKAYHQFNPHGYTILYMLSESHMSFHSYPERRYLAIDLYTCNKSLEFNIMIEEIYQYFKGCKIIKQVIYR